MQWYTKDARNSVRIADLKSIEKSLELYAMEVWNYPDPDNLNQTPKIRWMLEWKFGETNYTQVKKLDKLPKDPDSWELYDYNLVITKDAYELISKFWEWEEIKLWPLNKNGVYVNEETGYIFKKKNKTWPDSNCPLNDVEVYSYTWTLLQVWAWCNSTLWDWLEWWKKDDGSDVVHNNYQCSLSYSIVDMYSFSSMEQCESFIPLLASNAIANLRFKWTNPSWDKEYTTIWWKLYNYDKAMDWACPSWWHLPSILEFNYLENIIAWSVCRTWNWGQCDWLWWKWHNIKTNVDNLANILEIPLAWVYNSYVGFYLRGISWIFLSNTLSNNQVQTLWVSSYESSTIQNNIDWFYTSIRCIKDL